MADSPDFQKRVEEAMSTFDVDKFFDTGNPVDSLAIAQNETVKTFQKHDFSRAEALYLTAAMFNGNPGVAPEV